MTGSGQALVVAEANGVNRRAASGARAKKREDRAMSNMNVAAQCNKSMQRKNTGMQ